VWKRIPSLENGERVLDGDLLLLLLVPVSLLQYLDIMFKK